MSTHGVYDQRVSPKSRLVALLLCIFLGYLGVHHFYVNKVCLGILYLCTGGLFGIGVLVDFILILVGAFKDDRGLPLTEWDEASARKTPTPVRSAPYQPPRPAQAPRPPRAPAPPAPPTQQSLTRESTKKAKYCQICGSANELDSTYCSSCGSVIE